MSKSVLVSFRTKAELKEKADIIFDTLGISKTEAFNMFLANVILNNGIPFDVKIPNKETIQAIEDVENGKDINTYKNLEEFYNDLGI